MGGTTGWRWVALMVKGPRRRRTNAKLDGLWWVMLQVASQNDRMVDAKGQTGCRGSL